MEVCDTVRGPAFEREGEVGVEFPDREVSWDIHAQPQLLGATTRESLRLELTKPVLRTKHWNKRQSDGVRGGELDRS